MRIDKIVDAPREFIFEKIVDSCLFDIEKNTGKRPKVRSLNGYEYNKSFGKNQRGTIKITELREPSIYAFTTKTNRNTFSTRWELHKIDDRSTQVIIEENQSSNGLIQMVNDKAVGFFLGRFKKRQMVAILDNVNRAYNGGRAH
ncbi:DUF3284 domain-containing protein [Lactococcus cremoris]|jgi:hypothetical protein|uniref:DUF3284 domain-containing protein n=1 Tax=Lactococcus lactis subsp. cremoris (strain MG1363) TaxID=416870 RepID=A2RHQ2_LACLM|nr:DUF3284 domain-containing protein [Lactococcus cremoris]ADJ59207.1 hypothetical protein LLNZ_00955 [Lactococcus cremoris subsp. cremoris NZ9000]KZK52386.1 hypothetical protein NCDO763_0735 [Lactococcus cremoris]MCT4435006.1 DUF3284 domain-containing protein [Lactococcus cremoris]MCT4445723.1 DUF3284 domain-containing protein [Lactococcus cremoris]MCZ7688062.1 DUF3284 domain-containing protein [Lactococcus cremoris]